MITMLYRVGHPRSTDLPDFECEELTGFWESVMWALGAYRHHKDGNAEAAVSLASTMKAADWKVECLRWLMTKYKQNKGLRELALSSVHQTPVKTLASARALSTYVLGDQI